MRNNTAVASTVLLPFSTVLAQPAITIEVENPVLRPGESTVVTMFAGFESGPFWYAMGGLETDLRTSVGSDGWTDVTLLRPMVGPGTLPGTPSAAGFDEIIAGQLHFPGAEIFADPTNPIAFWQATYTAPSDPASPFDIELETITSRYTVYFYRDDSGSGSQLADLTEGAATIRVIPAPASALVLASGLAAPRRRREPDPTETRDA